MPTDVSYRMSEEDLKGGKLILNDDGTTTHLARKPEQAVLPLVPKPVSAAKPK